MEKRGSDSTPLMIMLVMVFIAGVLWWLLTGGYEQIGRYFTTETVYIEADYDEVVVDRPAYKINLRIMGDENMVSVTKETRLKKLEIEGDRNEITLCEGIHSPAVEDNGVENKIESVSC
ncbi:MAG: hypothetical protein ABIH92_05640 [Nanoarchaeota archaeon]